MGKFWPFPSPQDFVTDFNQFREPPPSLSNVTYPLISPYEKNKKMIVAFQIECPKTQFFDTWFPANPWIIFLKTDTWARFRTV